MIVYHGSPNKFEQFDYSRIRTNGTSEGVGFYFTDNKSIATGYGNKGYLYTVNLSGKKAMSDNEKTLTKGEIRTLIIELNEREEFLSNFGDVDYEGFEKVLRNAVNNTYDYCDTDSELISVIYNTAGENEIVIELFREVLGYDHITSTPDWGNQKLYIALTNDIIEIVEVEVL